MPPNEKVEQKQEGARIEVNVGAPTVGESKRRVSKDAQPFSWRMVLVVVGITASAATGTTEAVHHAAAPPAVDISTNVDRIAAHIDALEKDLRDRDLQRVEWENSHDRRADRLDAKLDALKQRVDDILNGIVEARRPR